MYIFTQTAEANKNFPHIRSSCPHCKDAVTFDVLHPNIKDARINNSMSGEFVAGLRNCPNPKCKSLFFFCWNINSNILYSYPFSKIDFDTTDIPNDVLKAFNEALDCQANNCFTASAIMIRKTLEEVCADSGATGNNLFERIESLKGKIVIPEDLLMGMHELRFLGNDAAHIESNVFNQVGNPEIEAGIEFAKELLKAIYQYKSLLKKLTDLKTPSSKAT